jgi:hypothetical protein
MKILLKGMLLMVWLLNQTAYDAVSQSCVVTTRDRHATAGIWPSNPHGQINVLRSLDRSRLALLMEHGTLDFDAP